MKKFLLFLFVVAPLWAGVDPGDLDTSFGDGGIVMNKVLGSDAIAYDVAIQADGKIVVIGTTILIIFTDSFAVARYNVDGSLDASFGNNGFVTFDFTSLSDAKAVAIQSDGKIVVVGRTVAGPNSSNFAVARLNVDGSLDTSFGPNKDGKLIIDFGDDSIAEAVAIQSDGKIVVVGTESYISSPSSFAVARLNVDGSLDTSFGPNKDGKLITDFGDDSTAEAAALQKDGKIVIAGFTGAGPHSRNVAVVRLNVDGSLDTSFGPNKDGMLITDFGDDSIADDVAISSDGKIVVVCSDRFGSSTTNVARYDVDGILDESFGMGGLVVIDWQSTIYFPSVAIQPDGKLVVSADSDSPDGILLFRLDNNGLVDISFGNNGFVLTDIITGADDIALSIETQADGKLVVVGQDGDDNFVLVRYLNNVVISKVAQALFAKYSLFPQYINRQSPNSI